MALVSAGEFLFRDSTSHQRKSLPGFYIDKYELTTRRYAKFLHETGREIPLYWNEVSLASDGERPVIGVTWHDADAYCRWAGKRLPTEQEWQKAAWGTDERNYPWGNQEPNRSLASYNWDGKRSWEGYSTLATVESYKSGKSPYGIYHIAGNVWEWTSSDADRPAIFILGGSGAKVIHGGSWGDDVSVLGASVRLWRNTSDRDNNLGFRCVQDKP